MKLKKPTIAETETGSTRQLTSIISSLFKDLVKEFENTGNKLNVGDLVLAKMTGFMPWPGKITSFTKDNRRAMCYFYGSHNNGPVGVKQIIPFEKGFETIRLVKMRYLVDFERGVRELEIEHGIPENMSSLRELASIQ